MNVVIAEVKQSNDAAFIARLIKTIKGNVKVMSEEKWEDYLLGLMADEAEAEGKTVPREKISKFLKKHGIDF